MHRDRPDTRSQSRPGARLQEDGICNETLELTREPVQLKTVIFKHVYGKGKKRPDLLALKVPEKFEHRTQSFSMSGRGVPASDSAGRKPGSFTGGFSPVSFNGGRSLNSLVGSDNSLHSNVGRGRGRGRGRGQGKMWRGSNQSNEGQKPGASSIWCPDGKYSSGGKVDDFVPQRKDTSSFFTGVLDLPPSSASKASIFSQEFIPKVSPQASPSVAAAGSSHSSLSFSQHGKDFPQLSRGGYSEFHSVPSQQEEFPRLQSFTDDMKSVDGVVFTKPSGKARKRGKRGNRSSARSDSASPHPESINTGNETTWRPQQGLQVVIDDDDIFMGSDLEGNSDGEIKVKDVIFDAQTSKNSSRNQTAVGLDQVSGNQEHLENNYPANNPFELISSSAADSKSTGSLPLESDVSSPRSSPRKGKHKNKKKKGSPIKDLESTITEDLSNSNTERKVEIPNTAGEIPVNSREHDLVDPIDCAPKPEVLSKLEPTDWWDAVETEVPTGCDAVETEVPTDRCDAVETEVPTDRCDAVETEVDTSADITLAGHLENPVVTTHEPMDTACEPTTQEPVDTACEPTTCEPTTCEPTTCEPTAREPVDTACEPTTCEPMENLKESEPLTNKEDLEESGAAERESVEDDHHSVEPKQTLSAEKMLSHGPCQDSEPPSTTLKNVSTTLHEDTSVCKDLSGDQVKTGPLLSEVEQRIDDATTEPGDITTEAGGITTEADVATEAIVRPDVTVATTTDIPGLASVKSKNSIGGDASAKLNKPSKLKKGQDQDCPQKALLMCCVPNERVDDLRELLESFGTVTSCVASGNNEQEVEVTARMADIGSLEMAAECLDGQYSLEGQENPLKCSLIDITE